jgi:choline kinase
LLKYGINKIYIVIGYKADKILRKIKNKEHVEFITNEYYASTDNIYSLYLALERMIGEEFILLNGDAVIDEEIVKRIVVEGKNLAPIDSGHYDLEELKVKEEKGLITRILPKNASREISDGSTIGIFKFSSKGSKILFNEIKKLVESNVKNKWFEYALNNILYKIKMYKIDIHGLKWIEVDTIDDIKKAQEIFGG